MKKILMIVMVVLLLCSCSAQPQPSAPIEPQKVPEIVATPEPILTPEPTLQSTIEPTPTPEPTPMPDMELTSVDIVDGVLANEYGAKGTQFVKGKIPSLSLPLTISYIPEDTKSLAISIIDPDGGNWVHWLVANIPISGNTLEISANASIDLADTIIQGKNDFGSIGYGGPTPPSGTHKYIITVYAIGANLDLKNGFSLKQFNKAISKNIVTKAIVTGDYSKK